MTAKCSYIGKTEVMKLLESSWSTDINGSNVFFCFCFFWFLVCCLKVFIYICIYIYFFLLLFILIGKIKIV